jgi:hypothetical protein
MLFTIQSPVRGSREKKPENSISSKMLSHFLSPTQMTQSLVNIHKPKTGALTQKQASTLRKLCTLYYKYRL